MVFFHNGTANTAANASRHFNKALVDLSAFDILECVDTVFNAVKRNVSVSGFVLRHRLENATGRREELEALAENEGIEAVLCKLRKGQQLREAMRISVAAFNSANFENVKRLGLMKASPNKEKYYGDILIGCDTIVVYDGVIYGKPVDEYRTTDNDFHVQMPWGYCGNEIFNGCRQGEVNAVEAERLNAFSLLLGGKSFEEKSEEAWKYILAAEHHDVTICGLLDLSRRFIPTSLTASDYVKDESLKYIASKFAQKDNESLFHLHQKLIGIYVKKKILLTLNVVLKFLNQDLLYIVAKVHV